MMRFIYSFIFYLALPAIVLRLLWRSIKAPAYRQRCLERFGFFPRAMLKNRPAIWLHTVSVGETIAAKPLMTSLLKDYPQHVLIITTMTPTGSAQVCSLFAAQIAQGSILHSYIPYDVPDSVSRFLTRTNPQLAIFMETEVWPNILLACKKKNIATVLINARLSEKSFNGYQKLASLSSAAFSSISHIAAQTEADAQRVRQLAIGMQADAISVTGNIKSEISVSDALYQQAQILKANWSMNGQKKIIIAASTHRGEDDIFLSAYQQLSQTIPNLLLVLVPRHPERFTDVKQLCAEQGFRVLSRSQGAVVEDATQIIVGDTMGEMMLLYGVADIAVVGGSFIEHGGHNMLEPAAWGLPIISGNSVYNFAKISADMQAQNALLLVDGPSELLTQLDDLLTDTTRAALLGQQAKAYVDNNVGALDKTLKKLAPYLTGTQ